MTGKRDEIYTDRLLGLVLWNEYLTGQSEESMKALARKMGICFPFEQTKNCYLLISGMERTAYREYGVSAIHYDDSTIHLWETSLRQGLRSMGYEGSYILEIYHDFKHLIYLISPVPRGVSAPVEQAANYVHQQLQQCFRSDFLPDDSLHGNFTVYSPLLRGQEEIMNAFSVQRQLHGYTFFSPPRRVYAMKELQDEQIIVTDHDLFPHIRDLTDALAHHRKDMAVQILRGPIANSIQRSMDRELCCHVVERIKESLEELCRAYSVDSAIVRAFRPKEYNLFSSLMDALENLLISIIALLQKTEQCYGLLTRNAVLYIRRHFTDGLSMQQIAEYEGISPAYLSRTFNKETGMSIPAYILLQRMRKASLQLTRSDAAINDIALQCGFSDPAYFCRQFKKQFHISPSEYRREKSGRA